jgi:hypothetical protein
MAKKEAVFSLKVDTGNSVKDVQNFDKAVNSLNKDLNSASKTAQSSAGLDAFSAKLDELDAKLASGTLTFREQTKVMKDYQTVASQAGAESPIGDRAIRSAAALKDELGDLQGRVKLLSSDYVKLDTAVAGIETGAAAYQGFISVTALLGTENEQLVQTMVQLQAVQGAVNSLQTVAKNLNRDELLGIQLKTAATKVYNMVVGESTGAMKGFRVALAASGVGLLVIGIAALIQNFDKLKGMFGGVSKEQEVLNSTMDDYKSAAVDATAKTQEVKVSFDLARKGVISKEEALKTYNDTLGATFGEASNLNEAERMFVSKTDAYIQSTALRAQADTILKMAAEQKVKSMLAYEDAQKNAIKAAKDQENFVTGLVGNMTPKLQKAAGDQSKIEAKKLEDLSAKLLTQANMIENNNGIISEKEKALNDSNKARADKSAADRKKRIEDELKSEQDRLKNISELRNQLILEIETAETAYFDSLLTQQQREEQAVTDKYYNLIEQATKNNLDTTTLVLAQESELAAIRQKADEDRLAKLAETEQKKLSLLRAYQAIVLDEYQNELIAFEDQQTAQKKSLEEALSSNVITQDQYNAAIIKMAEQKAKKEKEINDKKNKAIADDDKSSTKDKLANMEKVLGYAQQALDQLNAMNDLAKVVGENRINEIKEQSSQELANLDAKQAEELNKEGLTANQKKAIEEKFAMQKYQVQLKAFNEEEKIKKQQFERDKKLKIASIAINTAAAIMKGIAEFGPPPSPLGIAAIATAGVLGLTQAAAVAAQNYQGGSAPSLPSTGGGTSMAGASASSFTTGANTNTQQTDLTNLAGQSSNMTQVVVLESDITNTQNKVKNIETLSSF